MDFTLKIYKTLLQTLKDAGYRFITFEEYMRKAEDGRPKTEVNKFDLQQTNGQGIENQKSEITNRKFSGLRSPFVILRHDVDLLPQNSLTFARIQHEMGIVGSYYFRAVPESWDEDIIKEIHSLGHEVGYHYEDMDKVNSEKLKVKSDDFPASGLRSPVSGLPDSKTLLAIESFQRNLEKLRRLVPVSTICMHGSPRSKYDNRDLWKKYDYRDYGIIGEPYFDVDFNEMFYLTDTGRRWDGWKVSIRDKIPQQKEWINQGLVFRNTREIIEILKSLESKKFEMEHEDFPASEGSENVRTKLPDQVMMTFHPQRWTDKPIPWFKELMMQSAKNKVKYFINWRRGNQY